MNKKLIISICCLALLFSGICIFFYYNSYKVWQNWATIHGIKIESGIDVELNRTDKPHGLNMELFHCESDCGVINITNFELHPNDLNTANINFSVNGKDKNIIKDYPMQNMKIESGILYLSKTPVK